MAGNIVKWWKHKILGGYKQFSVQECTTDSEELMYHHQVRASSSCSAPPDLLLVNDRENNIPLRSDATDVIVGGTTSPSTVVSACPDLASSNNNQKSQHHQHHHHPQQQQKQPTQPQPPVTSYNNSSKDVNGRHQKAVGSKQVQHNLQQQPLENEVHVETQQSYSSTRHSHHHQQQRPEEHIRLEEFTCDVSVEGGKSSQPLQFSFTFYDLDGHHGKITKDDIVGIVYTIYESIGKSVVVPHSGSKTINVRLTVSPEGKSKASKAKKQQNVTSHKDGVLTSAKRLHRYRPRKLIKSDEEDDDSNSDKEREGAVAASNISNHILNKSSRTSRTTKTKTDQQCCQQTQPCIDVTNHDSVYEHLKKGAAAESCRECLAAVEETRHSTISPTQNNIAAAKSPSNEAYMKHIASTRIKMLRKSRKHKHQDCTETRQRSLSVGSEACWNNRHLQKPAEQQTHWNADQYLNSSDILDGVQMRNPLASEKLPMAQKRNSPECWKSALNRNDLISIIRESMEKNRLCFQLNGKPQANVSPIRQTSDHQNILQHKHAQRQVTQHQRQRSNTVSKIPMLIANHSYRSNSFSNNNDLSPNEHHNNSSNSNNIYQLQPHIPTYDAHMAMNPMVLTPPNGVPTTNNGTKAAAGHHSKINLCGYDSFLHATICGGGMSHSPPPHTPMHAHHPGATANSHHSLHQQIATVQPIMTSLNTNSQRAPKNMGLSMTPNQIRTSKILRSGSYSQPHQTTFTPTQNSPQHHGYQRLSSNNKQNMPALHLEKSQLAMLEKGRKEQVKNYDQLLYAKLAEKLQQTNLATTNKENMQRRRHRVLRHRRSSSTVTEANKVCVPMVSFSRTSDYSSLIPIGADPVECENLIVPTSDDECHPHHEMDTKDVETISRHVAEGTLVDLDDSNRDEKNNTNHSISNGILGFGSDNIDIHIDDELVVDEELDEEIADREDIGLGKSGRSSAASKEANDDIVANASGANTSTSSSLIHRYVHEHIHHHYHHFEDNDE